MEFLPEEISTYVEKHTSDEDKVLHELNRQTHLNVMQPRMLSGHLQGRALSMFAHMIQPQKILEVGTYTGYSAICMAEGLAKNGQLITIDNNEELEEMANNYFEKSGYADRIDFQLGNAMEIIDKLDDTFDMVFIDADKSNYINYYEKVINKMSKNGFVLFDNVLWSGKVLKEQQDKDTETLKKLNTLIQNDKRVENLLIPIRDGLMICRVL